MFKGEADKVAAVNKLAVSFHRGHACICAVSMEVNNLEIIAFGEYAGLRESVLCWLRSYGMWLRAEYGTVHALKNAEWSIVRLYGTNWVTELPEGIPGGRGVDRFIPQWKMRLMLGTHKCVPENWKFTASGMVSPESFLRKDILEKFICGV